jgi:hypothetical protein
VNAFEYSISEDVAFDVEEISGFDIWGLDLDRS